MEASGIKANDNADISKIFFIEVIGIHRCRMVLSTTVTSPVDGEKNIQSASERRG